MHRNTTFREHSGYFESWLPDTESLLIQLCDHLFHSGFVFLDSSETEIEAGGWVIRDFIDQEAEVLQELVPRKRFSAFCDYVNNFEWSKAQLNKKLCQRILKKFDQLAMGKHHHFNIRFNIAEGLRQSENHPLQDLLLYIETYHSLILIQETSQQKEAAEEPDFSKTNYKLEDLMQLRSQLQQRLGGHELVKGFLKHIAKARGVTPESLVPAEKKQNRQFPQIKFIRPSKQTSATEKLVETDVSAEIETPESTAEISKLEHKSASVPDQDEQMGILLEPDFEQFAIADASETEIEEKEIVEKEIEQEPVENSQEPETSVAVSSIEMLNDFDDDVEELEEDETGLLQDDTEETDVVFGSKKITHSAMEKFVQRYADSALKFLLRRTLDGRPLPPEIEGVYSSWEKRGLSRGRLKKYVLKLMEWSEVPEMPILDLLQILRDRIYEVSQKNKS